MTGERDGTSRQDRNGTPRVRGAREIDGVTVSRDAIRTAWRCVRMFGGPTEGKPMATVAVELREAIDGAGRDDVSRGMMTLLGALIGWACTSMDEGPSDDDALSSLLPPLLRLLRKAHPWVPNTKLPMLAGAITAAALRQDVSSWCDRLGGLDPSDTFAFAYLAWLVADLLDSVVTGSTTDELLEMLLDT